MPNVPQVAASPKAVLPAGVRIAGIVLRTLFIIVLVVVTARVASPQVETIWSIYDSPSEIVRIALGAAVCFWLVVHLFILPKDADGYRVWLYLGLALLPLAFLCAFIIW
jgi:membrane protein YdbS with pleckstrin-like domain